MNINTTEIFTLERGKVYMELFLDRVVRSGLYQSHSKYIGKVNSKS